jgi:hypothetical protein
MVTVAASAVLTSPVRQNGTITVAYPSGYEVFDFKSTGHKMVVPTLQAVFSEAADDFDISFGASNITVTYKEPTVIPTGTTVKFDLVLYEVSLGSDGEPNIIDVSDDVVTATGGDTPRALADWMSGMGRDDAPDAPTHFWSDYPTAGDPDSLRINRRMFIGQAVETNDARITGQESTDWDDYASWMPRDSDVVVMAQKGTLAISGLARTSDKTGISPTPSTWALGGFVKNDLASAFARVLYLEMQRESGAGGSPLAELVGKNKGSDLTNTPYVAGGGVDGIWLVAGGDDAYGGTAANPCNTGIEFTYGAGGPGAAYTWNKGIVFVDQSLTGTDGSNGDTGTGIAIEMAKQHAIRWLTPNGGVGALIKSNTANSGRGGGLRFDSNFILFTDASGNIIGRVDNVASPTDYVVIAAAASGGTPSISVGGDTTNKNVDLSGRGTGVPTLGGKPAPRLLDSASTLTAHTGNTDETVLKTIAIAANAIGSNGVLRLTVAGAITSSGNNKTLRVRLGGIGGSTLASAVWTTNATFVLQLIVQARNSASAQHSYGWVNRGTDGIQTVLTPTATSVDTTAALDLVITGQLASSGESIGVDDYSLEIYKK